MVHLQRKRKEVFAPEEILIYLVATVLAVAFTYPLWNVERNLAYD